MPQTKASRLVELSMVPPLAKEVAAQIASGVASKAQIVALGEIAVTATTGSLPTTTGEQVIANAATPTVVELLKLCMEIKVRQDAIIAALKA